MSEGGGTELVVVNPTFILGPTLTTQLGSSMQLIKAMCDGLLPWRPARASGWSTCGTWRPRELETTIVESAESLRDLGLLA